MGFFKRSKNKESKKESITVNPIGELPKFKYHPDPIKTKSIQRSENICESCGKKSGYIYMGPVFSEEELDECICPWCIADGSAHQKFDAQFTDFNGVGNYGSWEKVPKNVKEEVSYRTPGFNGWQQERWWTHCDDAALFLDRAGKNEIKEYGQNLIDELRKEAKMTEKQWGDHFEHMDKEGSPTAYVFKCRECGKLGGYSDFD